jgi:hypothetical protein
MDGNLEKYLNQDLLKMLFHNILIMQSMQMRWIWIQIWMKLWEAQLNKIYLKLNKQLKGL